MSQRKLWDILSHFELVKDIPYELPLKAGVVASCAIDNLKKGTGRGQLINILPCVDVQIEEVLKS